MIVKTRELTESLEKKYSLKESYWWEDWENLPKERTNEISKWAKNYVNEICKYDLRNYDITGPKFEDSNEKFTVIINNKIFNFDWEDVWVNKAYYDENREETLPDDHEYIYDTIDDDPIGYRIISTIESVNADPKYAVDYSDGKLNESLNEGWMPLNKISRYHNVADEFQVNDKLEIRNTKTGKIRTFTTNRGGQADDKVTVNTKNGKTTSVAKETLKDEIETLRSENLGKSPFTLTDSLNESFVEEWWGQTDDDPFNFAYEYGLTCKEVGRQGDEILYRFTGEKEDFDQAIKDGYFFSLDYDADEGHSEDLNESFTLNEAVNHENDEVNAVLRKWANRPGNRLGKRDQKILDDAGIEFENPYKSGNERVAKIKGGKNYLGKWNGNLKNNDKFDAMHYLETDRPSRDDTSYESKKLLRPYTIDYNLEKHFADYYSGERQRVKDNGNDKLEKRYDDLVKEQEKKMGDIVAKAKAKHPQYESLNEAQLVENPVIGAITRAAIPAAVDVASNAISGAIDAKLHDGNNLEEDFYDPTSWFYDLVNNYETWSGAEWNSWSQEERDAAVTRAMKHFLIDNQLSEEEAEEFKRDLTDNNFHTECKIFSELYGENNNLEEAIAGNSTIQRYIDFSINECYGHPAHPWQIYDRSVIEELNDLGLKEVQKAYKLWNKSFSSCINTLPRSKEYAAYYFTWDGGFNILVISEYYKCGIRVVHSKSEYDNNIYTRLSFEDKDGYKIDKTDDSSNSFEVICKEIISLTNDEFNIFKPALNAYAQVEDLLDLYYNHIKIEGPRGDRVLTVDGDPIWSTKEKWDVAD